MPKKVNAKKPGGGMTTSSAKKSKSPQFKGEIQTSSNTGQEYFRGITPVGLVLYPRVFKPGLSYTGYEKKRRNEVTTQEDQEYQVNLLFNKTDPILKSMVKQVENFTVKNLGNKGNHSPFKDGNDLYKQDKEKNKMYKNTIFMQLKRPVTQGPVIVYDTDKEEMLSSENLYPGCYCVAEVSFKTYKQQGGGVKANWSALMKVADGDRIESANKDEARSKAIKSNFKNEAFNYKVGKNGVVTYS